MISLFLFFLEGCSGLEKSESKKQRQINLVVETIKRKASDHYFDIQEPLRIKQKETYSWEKKYIGSLPRITKEFFRCKGHPLNPPIRIESMSTQVTYQIDCGGIERHSLPIREGKEFIYPILIELLNYIQAKTNRRVIITSGHRCPTHNLYVDSSKKNRVSKHLMGAEVDFYVESMEYEPKSILAILTNFYQDDPLKKLDTHWLNKEIKVTCHATEEVYNGDNQHKYPYLTIEVRYDRDKKKPVFFSWDLGYKGFYRNG